MSNRSGKAACQTLLLLAAAWVTGCAEPNADPAGATEAVEKNPVTEAGAFRTEDLVDGMSIPWGMDFLPDGRVLVTERSGQLNLIDLAGPSSVAIDNVPPVKAEGQGGLLDVKVDPAFAENGLIYLSYAHAIDDQGRSATRVARARLQDSALVDLEIVLTGPAIRSGFHFGSRLAFDDEGLLYVTLGDRGRRDMAQDLSTLVGKIVRINADGSVPQDNPFVAQSDADDRIYSYGHRNPQGLVFDPATGKLWSHEHGPRGGDEINLVEPGKNYGWPVITYGEEYRGGKIGIGYEKDGMEQPVHYYVPSIAPSGMAMYSTGSNSRDKLVLGALAGLHLNMVNVSGSEAQESRHLESLQRRIRDVEVGPDGLIYLLSDSGHLTRVQPAGAPTD